MEHADCKKLLWDVLSIPTVNGAGGEPALAAFLAKTFRQHGIEAKVEATPNGANVAAWMKGEKPGLVAFNGHLDTVPYGDLEKWGTDPAVPQERDGRLYARGASDMKSGLAAMAAALCILADRAQPPARDVVFLGTGDEEKTGLGARQAVANHTLGEPALLVIGEPTGGALGLAQKGCLWLRMTVRGRTSHGAYPWEGVNAVEHAFRLCAELSAFVGGHAHPLLGPSTAGISMIEGGIAPNMVPDACVAMMDLRTVPGLPAGRVLEKAGELAERMAREHGVAVTFETVNERRAVETAADHPEAVFARECVRRATGEVPKATGINFFTDASILADPALPVVLYGPGRQELAHKPDEWVDLAEYDKAVDVFLEMMTQSLVK